MFKFEIEKRAKNGLARAGKIITDHGVIETPAFVVVGTKATVKALTPEQVNTLGAAAVLANTYHLYLEPGAAVVKRAGGLHNFMNWPGPIFTDSGGFQVFSLGAAFEKRINKFASATPENSHPVLPALAKIDRDGVTFRSHIDGQAHRLTPEKSIQIQHDLGADIIFAFDECPSPEATYEYQREAMTRTHLWAEQCLAEHAKRRVSNTNTGPALFGIVQGGPFQDLREVSARFISGLAFDGFGIGGSFEKKDLETAVAWVNQILPAEKPRHLLGIGAPADLVAAVKNGVDTFDCVAPTRMARNGTLQTKAGRINILNAQYRRDFLPPEKDCACYTCQNYSRAYLAHLFRAKEMLGATLASIHNLYFFVNFVKQLRRTILADCAIIDAWLS